MTEQERAAKLADEIERKGLAFTGDEPCDLVGSKDESVIVAALRLLAASAAGIAALRPGDEIDLGEFGTVVLVPKEPTTGMANAGMIASSCRAPVEKVYRAMLAAAKEPGR